MSLVTGRVDGDTRAYLVTERSWVNKPAGQPQTGDELQRATQLIRTGNSSLACDRRIPKSHSPPRTEMPSLMAYRLQKQKLHSGFIIKYDV